MYFKIWQFYTFCLGSVCFREGGKFFLCIYRIWFFSPTKEIKNCKEKYPAPTHYVHHVYICPPRNYIQEFWDRFLPISALVWECEPPPPAAHPPKTALTWKESWANLQHVLPHGPRHKVPSVSGAGTIFEYEDTKPRDLSAGSIRDSSMDLCSELVSRPPYPVNHSDMFGWWWCSHGLTVWRESKCPSRF